MTPGEYYPPFTLLLVCSDRVVRPLSGSLLKSEYAMLVSEIKRLEAALIEERKNRLPTAPDAYWSCRRDEAERQLRAEGVIR